MSNDPFIDEANRRFPEFNKKERKKIAVLLRRRRHLGNSMVSSSPRTDLSWLKAEIAALDWVFDELEGMVHDEDQVSA